ncbi:hypothetical protein F7734_44165 [Scytonema sp. UIC 10036]|uniref:hypothetical protein n=1 Tax=Scytonema sp. UIC 10036 TaxID=2304196 RepID=UPI0012DA7C61|nr:hypothetical protein [Scytonema sp. UIC 10036]MUG98922.1 hypothetical protein [Scytonema sp. UIC 10036]
MNTLQYYTSSDCLERLTERFGDQLELLDRMQKLQLRAILTHFILGRETMSDDYSIDDAASDFNLWQLFIPDEELAIALRTLAGLTLEDAESLLEALQAQCRYGNARLATPIETMVDELTKQGIPSPLAKEAAYILVKVDAVGKRTTEQQAIINQVHRLVLGKK